MESVDSGRQSRPGSALRHVADSCGRVRDGLNGPPSGITLHMNELPFANASGFACIAVGNIDGDPAYDVWHVDQSSQVVNDYNDVYQTN